MLFSIVVWWRHPHELHRLEEPVTYLESGSSRGQNSKANVLTRRALNSAFERQVNGSVHSLRLLWPMRGLSEVPRVDERGPAATGTRLSREVTAQGTHKTATQTFSWRQSDAGCFTLHPLQIRMQYALRSTSATDNLTLHLLTWVDMEFRMQGIHQAVGHDAWCCLFPLHHLGIYRSAHNVITKRDQVQSLVSV